MVNTETRYHYQHQCGLSWFYNFCERMGLAPMLWKYCWNEGKKKKKIGNLLLTWGQGKTWESLHAKQTLHNLAVWLCAHQGSIKMQYISPTICDTAYLSKTLWCVTYNHLPGQSKLLINVRIFLLAGSNPFLRQQIPFSQRTRTHGIPQLVWHSCFPLKWNWFFKQSQSWTKPKQSIKWLKEIISGP